ncbi:MAG TPA: 16S rRNA (cytidine(1402)-2'-O)-methyltransferase [Mycobacteriales bacterium]|nr:16S rRNA (cytidine(1402)-2'-O)-methyltransferase [Mycobacteriales bacterium]
MPSRVPPATGRSATSSATSSAAGTLILAAAPIGNPGDASARLRAALAEVTVIAAEDTRRLRRLAIDLDVSVTARIVSYYDANERVRTPELIDMMRSGTDVLVITDAGMPSVSDPGYRLVAAAVAEGIVVTALPGPSAVTTALALSGLPSDRFCFEGFLPRKAGERRTALARLAAEQRTMVFFEAPRRLAAALADLATAFGADRPATVCRELTKTYQEVRRGPLAEHADWAATGEVRGEITVVVGGAPDRPAEVAADPAALAAAVADRVADGEDRRAAMAAVARSAGVPRRTVYNAVVTSRPCGDLLGSRDNER